ncbi:chondroadherin-like [Onthophagus taurus]|uniref:chondroadherin-like n=1 Tax=Onthophagus taurus TaxID=166361 RepID=UPI000C20A841|nr:podocan-like protein 1 [Onthophagus taurus]
MGGDETHPMWIIFTLVLTSGPILAMCPSRCSCNDDSLQASCVNMSLEVVPIQLNPEVKYINLSFNKINNILFTLSIYNNLVTLDLSSNKLQTLGTNNFESQRNLKHLNLSRNEIDDVLKDSFRGLRALKILDMSHNRLEQFTAHAFRELQSLEVLYLTGNQIIELEEDLLEPAKLLRELYMNSNQLLSVPESAIKHCLKLKVFSLSQNLIKSIEEEDMPSLPELEYLELNNNVIDEIHQDAFSGIASLEYLDLSDNNFTVVPTTSLSKLTKLTKLYLSGNFFTNVPPVGFRSLFHLTYLKLDRLEMLVKIDSRAFVDNIKLEKVWMDNNIALTTLPTRLFHGNPKLTYVSVKNCQISTLEASHFPLDQLKVFHLGGNPLLCNCSIIWLWKLVHLQKNKQLNLTENSEFVIDVDNITCSGPEQLQGLLLMNATESQVGCSVSWIIIAFASVGMLLVLSVAVGFLYCGPMRKNSKSTNQNQNVPTTPEEAHHYEEPIADKYIIGPSLIREYKTLPNWEPYGDDRNPYGSYNTPVKARPHIVYV